YDPGCFRGAASHSWAWRRVIIGLGRGFGLAAASAGGDSGFGVGYAGGGLVFSAIRVPPLDIGGAGLLRQVRHDLLVMEGLAQLIGAYLALDLTAHLGQAALDPAEVEPRHAHRARQFLRAEHQEG